MARSTPPAAPNIRYLEPRESKRVSVPITAHDLSLTVVGGGRVAVGGEWRIEVGDTHFGITVA